MATVRSQIASAATTISENIEALAGNRKLMSKATSTGGQSHDSSRRPPSTTPLCAMTWRRAISSQSAAVPLAHPWSLSSIYTSIPHERRLAQRHGSPRSHRAMTSPEAVSPDWSSHEGTFRNGQRGPIGGERLRGVARASHAMH